MRKWNNEELAILIRTWTEGCPRREIVNALPGRSWKAIADKAYVLSLKKMRIERPILSGRTVKSDISIKGEKFKFAIISDTHYGSRYAQISYLHQFYKLCEKESVETILHAGDLSEGNGHHYPGQQFEMHINGADNLKNFIVKNYPKYKGKTRVVSGWHDLDLWKYEGYDLLEAVAAERDDIEYLGQASARWELGNRVFEIIHPSGGTAYAISYRLQKIAEGFASENKPHVLIVGHFHKGEFLPVIRNIYGFQAGCWQAQTPFAVRKNLYWHYGGWIVEMGVNKNGITNMKTEWIPFYKFIPDDYRNFGG